MPDEVVTTVFHLFQEYLGPSWQINGSCSWNAFLKPFQPKSSQINDSPTAVMGIYPPVPSILLKLPLRATSHTRLRARDHYISSTLIGGKGGAGPSSLHTTLEGPME